MPVSPAKRDSCPQSPGADNWRCLNSPTGWSTGSGEGERDGRRTPCGSACFLVNLKAFPLCSLHNGSNAAVTSGGITILSGFRPGPGKMLRRPPTKRQPLGHPSKICICAALRTTFLVTWSYRRVPNISAR